jgi:hypothetical protein
MINKPILKLHISVGHEAGINIGTPVLLIKLPECLQEVSVRLLIERGYRTLVLRHTGFFALKVPLSIELEKIQHLARFGTPFAACQRLGKLVHLFKQFFVLGVDFRYTGCH